MSDVNKLVERWVLVRTTDGADWPCKDEAEAKGRVDRWGEYDGPIYRIAKLREHTAADEAREKAVERVIEAAKMVPCVFKRTDATAIDYEESEALGELEVALSALTPTPPSAETAKSERMPVGTVWCANGLPMHRLTKSGYEWACDGKWRMTAEDLTAGLARSVLAGRLTVHPPEVAEATDQTDVFAKLDEVVASMPPETIASLPTHDPEQQPTAPPAMPVEVAVQWGALGGMMYELRADGVYLIREGGVAIRQSAPIGSREEMIAWMDSAGFNRITPTPTPARESAEATVDRHIRKDFGDTRVDHNDRTSLASVASFAVKVLTADRAASDARIAELERGVKLLEETSEHHRKERMLVVDTVAKHWATIAEQRAEIERLCRCVQRRDQTIADLTAKLAALESGKGGGVDPDLLETARHAMTGMIAHAGRYTPGEIASDAIAFALALHAALAGKRGGE